MGLLDELKKQAETLRREAEAKERAARERAQAIRAQAAPALARIHGFLKELVEQLAVLRPQILVDYTVPGLGTLPGLRQEGYELAVGGDPMDSVVLRYVLDSGRRYEQELRGVGSLEAWLETAKRQGLQVHSARITDPSASGVRAKVAVDGMVPVVLRFRLDVEAGGIVLVVRNHEELVDRRHLIRPGEVDELFLDELGKYVLRQPNRFLVQEMPAELRQRLRRRLEEDRRRREPDTQTLLAQRLKSLFKRRTQLTLCYKGQSRELSGFVTRFTLGRGSTCDLVVNDRHVSRIHARIELRDERFVLVDESTNGTFVRLEDGQLLRLHRQSLLLSGQGLIGLGTEPRDDGEHVIAFSA